MRQLDFSNTHVLVFGDAMLDEYITGNVTRVSPEAPVPVLVHQHRRYALGGAANVAANVAALGGQVSLVAPVGRDEGHAIMAELLGQYTPGLRPELVVDATRTTTLKTRFHVGSQQLLRVDKETPHAIDDSVQRLLNSRFADILPTVDIIIVSDYAKGATTRNIFASLTKTAERYSKHVIVDPKQRDFTFYKGAWLVTPNVKELAQATGLACDGDDEIIAACERVHSAASLDVLVTRSEKGMALCRYGKDPVFCLPKAQQVFDVSGAGDTALASFALATAIGMEGSAAMRISTIASGIAVSKPGTAVVTKQELTDALQQEHNHERTGGVIVVDGQAASQQAKAWRGRGLKVGFTNGCFDIVHPGHVSLLRQAASMCDRLIVGLNSDNSVRRLKGHSRPVNYEDARAQVLAAMRYVDMVVIFASDTPEELITHIRPDVLIKGADYTVDDVIGSGFVLSYGGQVKLAEFLPGFSTSRTISKSKEQR
jgi:D-beta-D-heptose 7-phosphate kinase/D-beta-D-heptose 1-phosphate adenosyltransferase